MSLNFTLVLEIVAFLVFLWTANTFMFRRLRQVMDERARVLDQESGEAATAAAEADRVEAEYIRKLTEAHQNAAQQLRQTRQEAYQKHRAEMDARRHQADQAVAEFRDSVARCLDEERAQFPALVASLAKSIDERMRTEGTVR